MFLLSNLLLQTKIREKSKKSQWFQIQKSRKIVAAKRNQESQCNNLDQQQIISNSIKKDSF